MVNFFTQKTAAERYARGRPYFHPQVLCKIKDFLGLDGMVERALDIGCGTGQSTVALLEVAREIIGVDGSAEMLAVAPTHPRILYLCAPAEEIPLESGSFDLVTVACAFHWFDRDRCLAEIRRLLSQSGWLIIYENRFFGKMRENPEFERWIGEKYISRYPTPPRNTQPLTEADAERCGFVFANKENYTNDVSFSLDDLVDYLVTQTNVIAAIENGDETVEDVSNWLRSSVAPFFKDERGTFQFGGHIWYLQKG